MAALIPNPASVKRNTHLRHVLEVIATHPAGMSSLEIRVAFGWSMQRAKEYISIMLCGCVIERHRPRIDGKKYVYRYLAVADAAGIESFLADLAAQFAKPLGKQRLAIRMPELKKKHRPPPQKRSMNMTPTKLATLKQMQEMYDYINANPHCTMQMLCQWYESCASTLRRPLHHLRNGGFVEDTPGKRFKQGQLPSTFMVTDKGRPTTPPERKQHDLCAIDTGVKRTVRPARQLGMAPYSDLPAAFFARPTA